MTKKEAIENHRKMWNWIADETERKKKIVTETEYFRSIGLVPNWSEVYLNSCIFGRFLYREWCRLAHDSKWSHKPKWKKTAKYARLIANLPEREDVQDEG